MSSDAIETTIHHSQSVPGSASLPDSNSLPDPTLPPGTATEPADPASSTVSSSADPALTVLATVTPSDGGVLGGREQIDAVDAQIVELIQRRIEVSRQIQAARLTDGGRRVDLRRETEIIGRYTTALGRPGTTIAMALGLLTKMACLTCGE